MNLLLMLHMPKQNTGAKDGAVLGMITLGPGATEHILSKRKFLCADKG